MLNSLLSFTIWATQTEEEGPMDYRLQFADPGEKKNGEDELAELMLAYALCEQAIEETQE